MELTTPGGSIIVGNGTTRMYYFTKEDQMDDSKIIEEMYSYIDLAFGMSRYDTLAEIAAAAGLCKITVSRLVTHTTRFPRYLTLKKFGDACGLHLVWTKAGQPRLKMAG